MPIIDTTNTIETSMHLKARVPKNMVGENYYLQTLQQKIDANWLYRYNVIDIEEELEKQMHYTISEPIYTPVEVVVQHVRSEVAEKFADDWKELVFKDLHHPIYRGMRFRFSTDYEHNTQLSEEEKKLYSSIWIGVNYESSNATRSIITRRCNTNLVFAGSPTMDYNNITELHYEPCVLDDDLKHINLFTDATITINQGEIYGLMQYNYFTKGIKPNDRFFIGETDIECAATNAVYKVTGISKYQNAATFNVGHNNANSKVDLVLIALERDVYGAKDDAERRLTQTPALYKVNTQSSQPTSDKVLEPLPPITPTPEPTNPSIPIEPQLITYQLQVTNNCQVSNTILLEETNQFTCQLLSNGVSVSTMFIIEAELPNVKIPDLYYEIQQNDNTFFVTNKRSANYPLKLTFMCTDPNGEIHKIQQEISLGGYY